MKSNYRHKQTFSKLERIACRCASLATDSEISENEIYSGRTKTTLGISVARQMAFLFMHDHYGIRYRRIAEHAQMTIGAVMKNVRKARTYKFSDPVYKLVYNMMSEKL